MRQLTFVAVARLEWRDGPEPQLRGPGEALVRPLAVARCDLDGVFMGSAIGHTLHFGAALHFIDGPAVEAVADRLPYGPPFPVGHGCVAEVLAHGDNVRSIRIGQRVVVPFQVACGRCGRCINGLTSRCLTASPSGGTTTYGFGPGARLHGGMLAEVLHVPYADAMLVPLPAGVDPVAAASVSDNLPDAYRGVAGPLEQRPGAAVLVVGGAACSVGLYAAAIAKALGADVDYVDSSPERLALAERLRVRALEAPPARAALQLPRSYEVSVDACSDPGARGLEMALRSLAPGGICTSSGIYPRVRTPMPLMRMYLDGSTFRTGITNARAHIPAVLDLIA